MPEKIRIHFVVEYDLRSPTVMFSIYKLAEGFRDLVPHWLDYVGISIERVDSND